jgi:hypothetical protein
MNDRHSTPRKKRGRRLAIVTFGLVALLITVAIGAVLFAKSYAGRRLAAAIAAADRADPHWRLDDILATDQKLSDAENSAHVVADVIKLLPENWPSGPRPSAEPGQPKQPDAPALQVYQRLWDYPASTRLLADLAADVRATLAEQAEAVEIARTLKDFPRGRHELTIGPSVLDTLLPETHSTRTVARLLQMDALLRAHDGDLGGALESCCAMLNAGRSIGNEPFAISQLVRVAIGNLALDTARRVLALGEPSEAAIIRFQALIDSECAQPLLPIAINGERASQDELAIRIGTGQISVLALTSALAKDNSDFDLEPAVYKPNALTKPWYDFQRAVLLEWMSEAVVISRKPWSDQFDEWKRWEQCHADIKASSRSALLTHTVPLLLSLAISTSLDAHVRYEAMLRSTNLMLAAERHRPQTGRWPESAEKIDPAILPRPPIDPYNGRLIRLLARDGQLFVYCVGPNQRDDKGAYDPKQERTGGPVDIGTNAWDARLRGLYELPANVFQSGRDAGRSADKRDQAPAASGVPSSRGRPKGDGVTF